MAASLSTYLNDHLGGAQIAVQILERMRDQQKNSHYREFSAALLPQIEADDRVLRSLIEKIGASQSTLKQAGGWLTEKLGRLKLGDAGSDIETFESLELLVVGIHGKLCLWKALDVASGLDPRLSGVDFKELIRRAEEQYGIADRERLALAAKVLPRQ